VGVGVGYAPLLRVSHDTGGVCSLHISVHRWAKKVGLQGEKKNKEEKKKK
jgi:hypothetical protein